jgi:hypothetical protein
MSHTCPVCKASVPHYDPQVSDRFSGCDICYRIFAWQSSAMLARLGRFPPDRVQEWLTPEVVKVIKDKPEVYAYWARQTDRLDI